MVEEGIAVEDHDDDDPCQHLQCAEVWDHRQMAAEPYEVVSSSEDLEQPFCLNQKFPPSWLLVVVVV